jgi:hypothetical protein
MTLFYFYVRQVSSKNILLGRDEPFAKSMIDLLLLPPGRLDWLRGFEMNINFCFQLYTITCADWYTFFTHKIWGPDDVYANAMVPCVIASADWADETAVSIFIFTPEIEVAASWETWCLPTKLHDFSFQKIVIIIFLK